MSNAHDYAKTHRPEFLEQLKTWVRIPSISTDPDRRGDVRRAAEWLAAEMRRVGIENVEIIPTAGHPVVYGDWLHAGAALPTVLVYGHYDVQPADMVDGWDSNPFEPIERDGKLYARGSSDDKGQAFIHVKAAEALLTTEGKFPVNVKFLIEGEEEIGSEHLSTFLTSNRERLKSDICVISDTAILDINTPSIVYALRGLVYMELEVQGPSQDLHSGGFGGTVHNPAQALAEIITAFHNPDGSVSVPGFYEDVVPLSAEERAELRKTDWAVNDWTAATGAPQPWGEPEYTIRERIGARPTLEINGFASGFYGAGAKTVLPAKALAKISCRLVANQNPEKIYEQVRDYVAKITPPTIRSEVRMIHRGDAALMDLKIPAMQAAISAYEKGWGSRPVFTREGGSIPIVADFRRELGVPVILMGFGLNTDGAHGPNEHFVIDMFYKGIDTAIHFYKDVADLKG
jgi:acetylornithine deacetylase/succinyl-diaminopimelate desuccinylase-like protein